MPSNYQKIREENIRGYGEWTDHLELLGQLYTDRTHFIFELLQNAEDADATKIRFELFKNKLKVLHDGRHFDEKDVRGLCGVGKGTKTEDLTQIGKFGIGFKSVYAHTSTPEIHSGDEHFKIENYVRPSKIEPRTITDPWTTLFVFPFNSEKILPQDSFRVIEDRLIKLTARTLLFLRNIKEIEYSIENLTDGIYLREEDECGPARHISVIGEKNDQTEDEEWLIFDREVSIKNENVRVEISFLLKKENKDEKEIEQIVKINESPLVVYFPTEKETRLGFLVQGPFRTTPARDNVPKDNEWNSLLIDEISELVRDSLFKVKELQLITLSFLEVLPIRTDDFPEHGMFDPIVKIVQEALLNEELLPTDNGNFVSGEYARLVRGQKLIEILNQNQLNELFHQPPNMLNWLPREITHDRRPDLRHFLANELDVKEITPDIFARAVNNDFLSIQEDEWFIQFYQYLNDQEALWRKPRWHSDSSGILRQKQIIRLSDGSQVTPFKDDGDTPNAFLPPSGPTAFPIVSPVICEDKEAYRFLTDKLRLSEPDIVDEIINFILPRYDLQNGEDCVPEKDHYSDIKTIINAMESVSGNKREKIIQKARGIKFLRAINQSGENLYKEPTKIYLRTTELESYFSDSEEEVWFLQDYNFPDEIGHDVWLDLGVAKLPRRLEIHSAKPRQEDKVCRAKDEKVSDFELDGLGSFLNSIEDNDFEQQKESACLLWGILRDHLSKNSNFFKAKYEWFYYKNKCKKVDSSFLLQLRESRWIPTKDGSLKAPIEISNNDLIDTFSDSEELLIPLGIKFDQNKERLFSEMQSTLGINPKVFECLSSCPEFFKQVNENPKILGDLIKKYDVTSKSPPEKIPTKTLSNQERRKERKSMNYSKAQPKEYQERNRSIRNTKSSIDPRRFLREKYTNTDDRMVCQLCDEEMPFRKRNNKHYFEAKEILPNLPKEDESQYLALCPLCAAKYNEFITLDKGAIIELIENIENAEVNVIPISLGAESKNLRFVESHLIDLKTIIDENKNING